MENVFSNPTQYICGLGEIGMTIQGAMVAIVAKVGNWFYIIEYTRGDPEIRGKVHFFHNLNSNYILFVHNQAKFMPI